MRWLDRTVLVAILGASVSALASAQSAAKPLVLAAPIPSFKVDAPVSDQRFLLGPNVRVASFSKVFFRSYVYGIALRGIVLTDSATVKAHILDKLRQMRETRPANPEKWSEFYIDSYRKHVPELGAMLPANQRAIFERNVQALEQSNYLLSDQSGTPLPLLLMGGTPDRVIR